MSLLTISIIVILVVQLGLCIFFGIRNGFIKSVFAFVTNIICALAAMLIAKILAAYVKGIFVPAIKNLIRKAVSESDGADVLTSSSVTNIMTVVSCAAAAIFVFTFFYLVFYIVLKFPRNYLYKKFMSKYNYDENSFKNIQYKIAAPVICCISGFLATIMLLSPIAVCNSSFDKAASKTDFYETSKTAKRFEKTASNPVFKVLANAGGNAFFDFLTCSDIEDSKIELSGEVYNVAVLTFSTYDFTNYPRLDADERTELLDNIKKAFNDSTLLPSLVSSVGSDAAVSWKNDKEYLNHRYKTTGRVSEIYYEVFDIMSRWDVDTVKDDFSSLIDFIKLMVQKDIIGTNSDENLSKTFRDKDFVEDLLSVAFNNDNLKSLIPHILNSAVGTVCDKLNIPYSGSIDSKDSIDDMSDDDIKKEAGIIANITDVMYSIKEESGSCRLQDMTLDDQKKMLDALKSLDESKLLKGFAPSLISEAVKSMNFPQLTEDFLNKIKATDYDNIGDSVKEYYEDNIDKVPDKEEFKEELNSFSGYFGINFDDLMK